MHSLKALLLNAGCTFLAVFASPLTLTNSLPKEFNTIPLTDTSVDREALVNLAPSKHINLKYHDRSDPEGSLTLNIAVSLSTPAVILENSIFIEQVYCSQSYDTISLQISDSTARSQFINGLSKGKSALITRSKTCNSGAERGFFLQNGAVETGDGLITVPVLLKDLNSLSKKLDVTYEYVPEHPAWNNDLRKRAPTTTSSPCALQTGSSVVSLRCNVTGNLKNPLKTKFAAKVNDFNSCMQLCEKDATCMSFGFAKTLPAGKSCWTSVVSLAKQQVVINKSSPYLLYDRNCYKCTFSTTTTTTTSSTTRSSSTTTSRTTTTTSTTQTTTLSTSNQNVVNPSTTTSSSTTLSSTTISTTTSLASLPLAGDGWQTNSNILPTASQIDLVYNPSKAVAKYISIVKNLKMSGGTAQGSYVSPATATPPPILFDPNDGAAQASIASKLASIGLQGGDALNNAIAAQATFAAPNIPVNPPSPGADELGGGSTLPDLPGSSAKRSIVERAIIQVPDPIVKADLIGSNSSTNESISQRSIAQRSIELVPKSLPASISSLKRSNIQRSIKQAPTPELLARGAGEDFCKGAAVANDVCDCLEGLDNPGVEIGCGVVGLANFGCELHEAWDSLKCLFGGECPGPAPPPPPIALSYAPKATQLTWSQPANKVMFSDGVTTIYCVQCDLDIRSLGFSGTITIDATTKGIQAGNIVLSENSQRWLVLGLTTTKASAGDKKFYISTPDISVISVSSIFSITPSFSASFGLKWNVNNAYKDIQKAGAQIGQPGSKIYTDFYTKATQEQGEGKPGMRTFRPGLKPGDWMQTYAGTAVSIDYKTAGQTLLGYVNTVIEYAIKFNAQPVSSCGSAASGIAKQAYVMVSENTVVGGTKTLQWSLNKQLDDQCGIIGAVAAAVDGCGNQGAQWAVFDMNSIGGGSISYLYTIKPFAKGVIDFVGGFSSSVSGDVRQGQSQSSNMDLRSYGYGNGFPYFQRMIVTQGYMYAPADGTYTFVLNGNDGAGNYKYWLFWGPPGDDGIENFRASAYISQQTPLQKQTAFSGSSNLYMRKGNYYAYRMVIQLVQAYSATGFSHYWQVKNPDGSVWLDNNNHGDHNLVQYSCDETTAPRFPSWAEL